MPVPRFLLSRSLRLACALAALAAPSSAQTLDLLVSTSADETLGSLVFGDEEVVLHPAGGVPRLAWPTSTLALHLGPTSAGATYLEPGDLDALHDLGDGTPGGGLLFSLVSDEGGWKDGDVLRTLDGGVSLVWSEDTLVAAVGATDGNLDIDALQLDDDGWVLFSLAEDEDSAWLSGDQPGVVQDGDVLRWNPATGVIEVLLTESAVAGLVAVALGGSATIGDTKGLARDPADGSLLFCVQSPSAHDGSVFSAAGGGSLLAGHAESDFGFGGAGELDALCVAHSTWATLQGSEGKPAAGTSVSLTLGGAQPGTAWVLLMSTESVPNWFPLPGWGGLVLSEDLLFQASLKAFPFLVRVADGLGECAWSFDVPPTQPPQDVVLQAASLSGSRPISNPVLLEVAQ